MKFHSGILGDVPVADDVKVKCLVMCLEDSSFALNLMFRIKGEPPNKDVQTAGEDRQSAYRTRPWTK